MEQETKRCPYCGEEILAIAKKCKHCGEWLNVEKQEAEKKMINCPICGELIEEGTNLCPHCKEDISVSTTSVSNSTSILEEDQARSFFDYYLIEPFFRHYLTFNARLNRKHYWMSMFVWFLIFGGLFTLFAIQTAQESSVASFTILLWFIWLIATLIPLYATTVRRLRDVDSEPSALAWLLLLTASPILLFWTCKESEDEDIRTDGLEPDEQQTVEYKKGDKIITIVLAILFFFGIIIGSWENGGNNKNLTQNNTEETNDEIIQEAIQNYLLGNDDAVYFTESAKQDLNESTWPEVHCSVDGTLNSPSEFEDLTVISVKPGFYKYRCTCPAHGDLYLDCWTISASLSSDGIVKINHVTLDDDI